MRARAAEAVERVNSILRKAQADPLTAIRDITRVILLFNNDLVFEQIKRSTELTIQSGPFKGMRYLDKNITGASTPKLLGCYESELHQILFTITMNNYQRVVNIGCGEGYYSVGLAVRLPLAKVYAFDVNPQAREDCKRLADANHVSDRVILDAECTPRRLNELVQDRTLVFSDCEGAELPLLDPYAAPRLIDADILVECHDFLNPSISADLCRRFTPSHDILLIPNSGRDPNGIPLLKKLPPLLKFLAIWEGRPGPTPWIFMSAKKHSG